MHLWGGCLPHCHQTEHLIYGEGLITTFSANMCEPEELREALCLCMCGVHVLAMVSLAIRPCPHTAAGGLVNAALKPKKS